MIIKNDSVNATVLANQTIDTTNFPSRLGGIPISQLSRQQQDIDSHHGRSQMSSRNEDEGSA
jgi:hypothetical protein